MNKILFAICIIGCTFCGCTDECNSIEARYDAMTGEKLPEKPKPYPIHWFARGDGYEVAWTTIDGHLYFIAGSSERYVGVSMIHAESCPCKTNNLNKVER